MHTQLHTHTHTHTHTQAQIWTQTHTHIHTQAQIKTQTHTSADTGSWTERGSGVAGRGCVLSLTSSRLMQSGRDNGTVPVNCVAMTGCSNKNKNKLLLPN